MTRNRWHSMVVTAGRSEEYVFPGYSQSISRIFPYHRQHVHTMECVSILCNWTKLWKLDFPTFFYNIFKIFPYCGRGLFFQCICQMPRDNWSFQRHLYSTFMKMSLTLSKFWVRGACYSVGVDPFQVVWPKQLLILVEAMAFKILVSEGWWSVGTSVPLNLLTPSALPCYILSFHTYHNSIWDTFFPRFPSLSHSPPPSQSQHIAPTALGSEYP